MSALRTLRKGLKLSQEDIAKRIGVQKAAVSRWETGERTMPAETAIKIEQEFGIPREATRPDLFARTIAAE